ncbi:hypothetical protein L484_007208 [Morus notabilis]|uniref:FLZ-type domain-containing protein n=1 Tax=Morus notabilis TaxID=981085 RepID=W9RQU9_9ROSA|nr:uncharacterized protein LOC21390614 [Morus notabilis]EXC03951.1 hypothetical protein L484_007208 [Morus notabilis]
MVGLSIVLEGQKSSSSSINNKKIINHQVINKTTMIINNNNNKNNKSAFSLYNVNNRPFLAPTFLEQCFLCHQKLLPGKDIYMYRGDRAFCSVECRCRQIFMDDEESILKDNCSLAAIKPSSSSSSSSSSSCSSSSSSSSRHRKGARNKAGGFAC